MCTTIGIYYFRNPAYRGGMGIAHHPPKLIVEFIAVDQPIYFPLEPFRIVARQNPGRCWYKETNQRTLTIHPRKRTPKIRSALGAIYLGLLLGRKVIANVENRTKFARLFPLWNDANEAGRQKL